MSEIVIKAESIGKSYLIGHKSKEKYVALRDDIVNRAKGLWSNICMSQSYSNKNIEEFWALRDISFEVKKGERIGIIGRNGAGKSTLLKILSRITEPTTGRISIKGRVASLLEVGTGFHPELTGRENIYLNGAVLGMTRQEIKRKFDEIVAFAEVEKFLDTPVKHFSSGMYVRLAFAVAAHLEPEILIVDEVLAVGDAQFQKKCLGKMSEVSQEGRTVFFVSHNMGTVRQLCNKGILLNEGKIQFSGESSDAISHYEKGMYSINKGIWINKEIRKKNVFLERIEILDQNNQNKSEFLNSELIRIMIHIYTIESTNNIKLGFDLIREGVVAFRTEQVDALDKKYFAKNERNVFVCEIPKWTLNAGEYFIKPLLSIHCVESLTTHNDPVLSFKINIDPKRSEFHTVLNEINHPGATFPTLTWNELRI